MGLLRLLGGAALGFVASALTGGAALPYVIGGAIGNEFIGSMSDDDIAEKSRNEGYTHGVRAGNQEAAKRFTKILEDNDDMKKAVFALGICIANLDDTICDYDKEAIQSYIGKLDSQLVSKKLQKEYDKIYKERPDFTKVKSKYLDKLESVDFNELDCLVKEIIFDRDNKPTKTEKDFYKKTWVTYVKARNKDLKLQVKSDDIIQKKKQPSTNGQKKVNKRVYEIAKEYGVKSKVILALLLKHGIDKTPISLMDEQDMKIIYTKYAKSRKSKK